MTLSERFRNGIDSFREAITITPEDDAITGEFLAATGKLLRNVLLKSRKRIKVP